MRVWRKGREPFSGALFTFRRGARHIPPPRGNAADRHEGYAILSCYGYYSIIVMPLSKSYYHYRIHKSYHLLRQNFADILEPFCNGPKTEVALINAVQVYSYEDTRIIKAFPQILKVRSSLVICVVLKMTDFGEQVLYNKDCISDQAIIYWHQKGAKPQGKQHFLAATAPLVKVYPHSRSPARTLTDFVRM